MDCSLHLVTPPEIEPVTAAEVKLHTHISGSTEDTIIEGWIASARMLAEDYQRRAFIGQMWEMSFDCFPDTPIFVPRSPLIGVMSIKCYDVYNTETVLYSIADNPITTTTEAGPDGSDNDDFIIDTDSQPGRIGLAYNIVWPSITLRPMNAVKIRFAAGYGLKTEDVPAQVKDAIMLYCAYRNENRAAEVDEAPKQFYNLLSPNRIYL
jgi:hypothetical protein